ncbi:MAG: hypothetical protein IJ449_10295 [Clostridia bacterium]|nr:hypothetical protein [Clostridia bacterium]
MFNDTHTGIPLLWELPQALCIRAANGEVYGVYAIHPSFSVGLYLRCLWEEPYYLARPGDLMALTCAHLFVSSASLCGIPFEDLAAAVLWYLLDGRVTGEQVRKLLSSGDGGKMETGNGISAAGEEQMLSYKWDLPEICSSFLQVYGIDLCAEENRDLHLWQFDALLRGLPADCALGRTLGIRGCDLSALADDDARALAAAERMRVRIPPENVLNTLWRERSECNG